MTRTYAMRRLLEHGPLTHAEMCAICGWGAKAVFKAVENLSAKGRVVIDGNRKGRRVYRLAD